MFSLGALIWISLRPLLRLAMGAASGFIITRLDMFPPVAARGASQIILNVTTPCLLFSRIIPAFNSDNIRVFGPLLLVASLYEIFGIVLAWIVRQLFWVPHRFRHGILVAGGWGNVGDIPISVIVGVTATSPFRGVEDQNLSVAYISIYVLVFIVSLFPMGAHNWIKMDFVGPDVEPCDVKEAVRQRRRRMLFMSASFALDAEKATPARNAHAVKKTPTDIQVVPVASEDSSSVVYASGGDDPAHQKPIPRPRRLDTIQDDSETIIPHSEHAEETVVDVRSPGTSIAGHYPSKASPTNHTRHDPIPDVDAERPETISFRSQQPLTKSQLWKHRLKSFLSSLLTAPSIAIFISFPIALIPQLKGLFIPLPATSSIRIPNAPDGQPPLSFIMDTATFIGNASVPLGLICLGSALARLKVPRGGEWKTLPLGAISSLAIGKLLLMPVIGVLLVQGMVRGGIIPAEDKVLRFVCIFTSCLPTATTQVYLTQVYSAEGDAEHLSAFLIPQYILMFFSMTALTAYTLNLIF